MNINDMTIGQAKELAKLFGGTTNTKAKSIESMIGKKCIIRTYSAGVFFGEIIEKSGSEVIVKNARRLWRWQCKESISLSSVAIRGLDESKSKVCEPLQSIWLEAIELIPCEHAAIISIEGCENVKAS